MKRTAGVLILTFAASVAWAQVSPRVVTDVRKSVTQVTAPAASQTESLGAMASKVAKPIAVDKTSVPPKPAAKKKVVKPISAAAAPASTATPAPAKYSPSGKRDPFVSPIVSRIAGPVGCRGGKKCLVIDQVALKGVVKAPNGMIAVIENAAKKAYFMRENDPVFNGFVVKITTDSIVFRETVTDRIGRTSTRDIVKRVNIPSV